MKNARRQKDDCQHHGPSETGGHSATGPQETIARDDLRFRHYVRNVAAVCVGLTIWLASLALLAIWDGGIAWSWPDLLGVLACVAALPLCLLGLGGFGALFCWRWKAPRVLSECQGDLVITHRRSRQRIALADCTWGFGTTIVDPLCMFIPRRTAILIYTQHGTFACGLDTSTQQSWLDTLKSSGVRVHSTSPWKAAFALFWLSLVSVPLVGLPLGMLAGLAVGEATGDSTWNHALLLPVTAVLALLAPYLVTRHRVQFDDSAEPGRR